MTAKKSRNQVSQGETASPPTSNSKKGARSEGDLLKGRRIAILATDGFEQVEPTGPKRRATCQKVFAIRLNNFL